MEQEIWLQVKGYEGIYEISNLGRFKSCTRQIRKKNGVYNTLKEKIIEPNHNIKDEYVSLALSKEQKVKTLALHILLATAFLPNPENKRCINHKDGNKKNNKLENLEWCTHQENMIHALDTGLTHLVLGEKASNAKLKEHQVLEIFNNTVDSSRVISEKYNISRTQYSHIKSGYSWSHLTKKVYTGPKKQSKRLINYI